MNVYYISDILNIEYLGLQLAEFGTKCLPAEIHPSGVHSLSSKGMDTGAGAGKDVFLQHWSSGWVKGGSCSQAIVRSSSRLGAETNPEDGDSAAVVSIACTYISSTLFRIGYLNR